jgi:hypothetical protein
MGRGVGVLNLFLFLLLRLDDVLFSLGSVVRLGLRRTNRNTFILYLRSGGRGSRGFLLSFCTGPCPGVTLKNELDPALGIAAAAPPSGRSGKSLSLIVTGGVVVVALVVVVYEVC